jgi:hypothetical protein
MLRKSLAIALLMLGMAAAIAGASVPKVVILEEYGATW